MPGPNIIIVGGGLSGLCLAHALVAQGCSVTVFERDPSRNARGQGYRLTIDDTGSESLQACLPPRNYDFIRATAGAVGKTGAFVFLDEHARELHRFTFDLEAGERRGHITGQVDRHTLRQALFTFILAKRLRITKRCQAGSLHTSLTGQQLKGTCSSVLTGRIHGFGDSACPRPNRATRAFAECLDAPQSLASTFPSSADCSRMPASWRWAHVVMSSSAPR